VIFNSGSIVMVKASSLYFVRLATPHVKAGEGEAATLARKLKEDRDLIARINAAHDQTKATLRDTEKSLIAQKGVTTRIKNRASNGVCPCCNRTFQNLARHMHTKHPDFAKSE
jgi:DNA repair exonuclease SbcCD ATPase subunit